MTSTLDSTLADDKRQATVERILRAARHVIGEQGLDATMEEIAVAAGVGRRTVFRHFATHDGLLAALESAVRRYSEQIPGYDGGDWRRWLQQLCAAVHRMNGSYGPGYWELTTRRDLPSELAAAERKRRRARLADMNKLAGELWSAAGGNEQPPKAVTATVGAHLSVHFTAAVIADAGDDWRRAAELASAAIAATILEELASDQAAEPPR